jgi:hypothetical protein
MNAGLIFVSTDDTIAKIIKAITRQKYNYVGFFINSEQNNITRVWLIDIFTASKPDWIYTNTFSELLNSKIVLEIGVKKLKPIFDGKNVNIELTLKNIENFKLSICAALQNHIELDFETAIYKIFGYPCVECVYESKNCDDSKNWCKKSANDLVNTVFKNLGIFEDLKLSNPNNDSEIYDSIKDNYYSLLAYRIFNVNQSKVPNIFSYLNEDEYFDKIEIVPNPVKDINEYNNYMISYNNSKEKLLFAIFATFNNIIKKDGEFKQTIISNTKNKTDDSSKKIISKLNYNFEKLLNITKKLLAESSKSKRRNTETDLQNILDEVNRSRTKINSIYDSDLKDLEI